MVICASIWHSFGTIAVQNVMFFELVGPKLAGVILGLSFIVHQIDSAGGPMMARLGFDRTGSYDGFMIIMSVIFFASAALVYSTISGKPIAATAPGISEART